VDVTPRGSQFIDYDAPCDVLTTNGAISATPSAVHASADNLGSRQSVAVRATEPSVLMSGHCSGVARIFAQQTKKNKKWFVNLFEKHTTYNLFMTERQSKFKCCIEIGEWNARAWISAPNWRPVTQMAGQGAGTGVPAKAYDTDKHRGNFIHSPFEKSGVGEQSSACHRGEKR